jgi:hypothetical protein
MGCNSSKQGVGVCEHATPVRRACQNRAIAVRQQPHAEYNPLAVADFTLGPFELDAVVVGDAAFQPTTPCMQGARRPRLVRDVTDATPLAPQELPRFAFHAGDEGGASGGAHAPQILVGGDLGYGQQDHSLLVTRSTTRFNRSGATTSRSRTLHRSYAVSPKGDGAHEGSCTFMNTTSASWGQSASLSPSCRSRSTLPKLSENNLVKHAAALAQDLRTLEEQGIAPPFVPRNWVERMSLWADAVELPALSVTNLCDRAEATA